MLDRAYLARACMPPKHKASNASLLWRQVANALQPPASQAAATLAAYRYIDQSRLAFLLPPFFTHTSTSFPPQVFQRIFNFQKYQL